MTTWLFILLWVLVALTLLLIAFRGGPRGAREALHSQSPGGRRAALVAFVVTLVGGAVVVPALILTGNHANASTQFAGVKLTAEDRHGRTLFGEICGSCHTLAAARTVGKLGPNLDVLRPPKVLVLDALAHGRMRGNGTMPAGLVQGRDADAVADFVSKVAGR